MALGPVGRARPPRRWIAPLAALALAALSAPSHADSAAPPASITAASAGAEEIPRFGPPRSDEPRSTGREVVPPRSRPDDAVVKQTACSFTEAVCVRAAESVAPAAVLRTL